MVGLGQEGEVWIVYNYDVVYQLYIALSVIVFMRYNATLVIFICSIMGLLI